MNRKILRIVGGICFALVGVFQLIAMRDDQPLAIAVPPILDIVLAIGLLIGSRKMVAIVGCILAALFIFVGIINGPSIAELLTGISYIIFSVFLLLPEKTRLFGLLACITYLFGNLFIYVIRAHQYGYSFSFGFNRWFPIVFTIIGIVLACFGFVEGKNTQLE